jgi:hypothetical protein
MSDEPNGSPEVEDDPLESVIDVARRWQVDRTMVADLVARQAIPSLDGGDIVRRGRLEIPCLRASWAERIRVDSPGGVRRMDDPYSDAFHPAAQVGFAFHTAVLGNDAAVVWRLSTERAREECGTSEALLKRWIAALGLAAAEDTSFTSGVYRLDPYPGAGTRIGSGTLPLPLRIKTPTPISLAGIIPLIEETGGWHANLDIAELDVNWGKLLASALPEPSQRDHPQ